MLENIQVHYIFCVILLYIVIIIYTVKFLMGYCRLAEILLRRGADPNEILIVEGVAPMHIAAGLGESYVKLLLSHGGNPNVRYSSVRFC